MKQLIDHTSVPSRCYYYLLDWKETHDDMFGVWLTKNEIKTFKLSELNHEQFWDLFKFATHYDQTTAYRGND